MKLQGPPLDVSGSARFEAWVVLLLLLQSAPGVILSYVHIRKNSKNIVLL